MKGTPLIPCSVERVRGFAARRAVIALEEPLVLRVVRAWRGVLAQAQGAGTGQSATDSRVRRVRLLSFGFENRSLANMVSLSFGNVGICEQLGLPNHGQVHHK